jgi:hypothetical protein
MLAGVSGVSPNRSFIGRSAHPTSKFQAGHSQVVQWTSTQPYVQTIRSIFMPTCSAPQEMNALTMICASKGGPSNDFLTVPVHVADARRSARPAATQRVPYPELRRDGTVRCNGHSRCSGGGLPYNQTSPRSADSPPGCQVIRPFHCSAICSRPLSEVSGCIEQKENPRRIRFGSKGIDHGKS